MKRKFEVGDRVEVIGGYGGSPITSGEPPHGATGTVREILPFDTDMIYMDDNLVVDFDKPRPFRDDEWCASRFRLVCSASCHTAADLAMALHLAELLDNGSVVTDWPDVSVAMWLRRQVRESLQSREAQS